MDPTIGGVTGWRIVLLAVIALIGGVGITSIGPGGIFVTISLYLFTAIPHGTVAGTASATFIATGLLGAFIYHRSGELGLPGSQLMVGILCGTGLIGAICGVWLNGIVSERTFGILLGGFVSIIGIMVWRRAHLEQFEWMQLDVTTSKGWAFLGIIGLVVGIPGGLLGVGGPVLAVPLLVVVGTPMLVAIAVAQVQSIVIATVATGGYFSIKAVSIPLAVLIGVPELIGVVVGWKTAHIVDSAFLKRVLGIVLLAIGPYIALS